MSNNNIVKEDVWFGGAWTSPPAMVRWYNGALEALQHCNIALVYKDTTISIEQAPLHSRKVSLIFP
jgi:hypothetical protein